MNKNEYPYKFKAINRSPLVLPLLNMGFLECN